MPKTKNTDGAAQTTDPPHRSPSFLAKLDLGLTRFHRNLRLIALGAPEVVIADSQRLIDRSVAETGLSEAELAKLYPTFRIVALVRDALAEKEAEHDRCDDCDAYESYGDDDDTGFPEATDE